MVQAAQHIASRFKVHANCNSVGPADALGDGMLVPGEKPGPSPKPRLGRWAEGSSIRGPETPFGPVPGRLHPVVRGLFFAVSLHWASQAQCNRRDVDGRPIEGRAASKEFRHFICCTS